MRSLATLRKCVYPFPVYEAHFADGTVGRLSVWQPLGKPWDWARARDVTTKCAAHRKVGPWPGGELLVAGYLEHDVPGQPWLRIPDPMTDTVQAKRANTKAMVRALLTVIDGGQADHMILEQARQWAA